MQDLNSSPTQMMLAFMVVLFPLLSFLVSMVMPTRFSKWISVLSPMFIAASFIAAAVLFIQRSNENYAVIRIEWFSIGKYSLSANMILNGASELMAALVTFVSFLVHVYSGSYMAGDSRFNRYFAMLGFFTFSMLGIVMADSLLLLFFFWELVGFSSYMLVGHWMEKPAAAKAAFKAFVVNRIGDAGFLVGLMIFWAHTGTFNISEAMITGNGGWETAASLCILCGVAGKSAQFPLFTWLPDAMEGPTPVSALIHAATMVAAGVYLLLRTQTLFTPDALVVVAFMGMITAITGALVALFQFDIKKILAYSTISQLGLMVMMFGLKSPASAFHLYNHAFFKACLFLCAGSIIHVLHHIQQNTAQNFDVQDIRNLGGLRKKLPVTFICFLMSGASLAGIPLFSGFLSKEGMLMDAWANASILSWPMTITVLCVSFITVLYTFRLMWYVFMGEERKQIPVTLHEPPWPMLVPMIVLAACSLWLVTFSWNPLNHRILDSGHHDTWITVFSIFWVAMALAVAYFVFRKPRSASSALFENAFYFDRITKTVFEKVALSCANAAGYVDKKWIDRFIHGIAYAHVGLAHITGWIDRAVVDGSVNGIASLSRGIGSFTRSFQGGKIQLYIFWAILAIIIFLIWTLN
jgi:NADH-quinone oxidoreductase subunit L